MRMRGEKKKTRTTHTNYRVVVTFIHKLTFVDSFIASQKINFKGKKIEEDAPWTRNIINFKFIEVSSTDESTK